MEIHVVILIVKNFIYEYKTLLVQVSGLELKFGINFPTRHSNTSSPSSALEYISQVYFTTVSRATLAEEIC